MRVLKCLWNIISMSFDLLLLYVEAHINSTKGNLKTYGLQNQISFPHSGRLITIGLLLTTICAYSHMASPRDRCCLISGHC